MDSLLAVLLLWLHLLSLALGGVATFGIPVVASRMPTASAELRPLLASIIKTLSTIGRAALVVLLITGPLLLWLKYGWMPPAGTAIWFGLKMLLVVVLLGLVIYAGILMNRVGKGDLDAARQQPRVGMAAMVTFVLIVLSAALAFN